MRQIDRHTLLQKLDERHDDLSKQLDELIERIEQALAAQSGVTRNSAADPGRSDAKSLQLAASR